MTFSILLQHPEPQKHFPEHFSIQAITFHLLELMFSILGLMKYGVILNANMHEMV